MDSSGTAWWEEEDYCSPPLAEERAAVLDEYFDGIEVEPVARGEGWRRIEPLPRPLPCPVVRGLKRNSAKLPKRERTQQRSERGGKECRSSSAATRC